MKLAINDGWRFYENTSEHFPAPCGECSVVRLPHTVKLLPYNYARSEDYELVSLYERTVGYDEAWRGKRVFVTFGAAAHIARVFLNGELLTEHRTGYTAFTAELTGKLREGENTLSVIVDSRETSDIPPFGGDIDYLTYGGLYREAYLEITEETRISDAFVYTPDVRSLAAEVAVDGGLASGMTIVLELCDGESVIYQDACDADAKVRLEASSLPVEPYTLDAPRLYTVRITLRDGAGAALDERLVRTGFRTAEFRADGFYLNGERLKLIGLDRHQSYPYIGYAAPRSLQRFDADALKRELGVNIVRASHYPESHHFIDRCDELGLLVFIEIPGWQHIGGEEWKKQAVINTREMVTEYRNHPSIICWGVRINESGDDDALYSETNAAAHALDPTRQTTGVRVFEKSHLLEDFYSFNDFIHSGKNMGVRKKSAVTPDMNKGYLITEHNGHMFPTKAFDDEEHRLSHALRHARVVDGALGGEGIAGAIGWCMFDYNTHYDFGSGDGICYHGVMDMFRNEKLAASLYSSQSDGDTVLTVSSSMAIGDHPKSNIGDIYAFTNADYVRLYKNGEFVSEFYPDRKEFPNLPHPPVKIDDFVGDLIEKHESMSPSSARKAKECMLAAAKYGLGGLPLKYKLTLAYLMAKERLTMRDGIRLYSTYVGGWGTERPAWRFEAVRDGKTAAVRELYAAYGGARLEVTASSNELAEGETYDMALVRLRAVDLRGNPMHYFMEAVTLETEGEIDLVGPNVITLKGGMGGALVRTRGKAGRGALVIRSEHAGAAHAGEARVEFEVKVEE